MTESFDRTVLTEFFFWNYVFHFWEGGGGGREGGGGGEGEGWGGGGGGARGWNPGLFHADLIVPRSKGGDLRTDAPYEHARFF